MTNPDPEAPDIFPWGFQRKSRAQVPVTTTPLYPLRGSCPFCSQELTRGMTVTLTLHQKGSHVRNDTTLVVAGDPSIAVACADAECVRNDPKKIIREKARGELEVSDGHANHVLTVHVKPAACPMDLRKKFLELREAAVGVQNTSLGGLVLLLRSA